MGREPAEPESDLPAGAANEAAVDGDAVAQPSEQEVAAVLEQVRGIASSMMRSERPDHTLQTTALVNEAYMRLQRDRGTDWQGDANFYRAAAEAMRRVLIDHARTRLAAKRGGSANENGDPGSAKRTAARKATLNVAELAASDDVQQLLDLEDAMAALADADPRSADVVRLRVYAGMSVDEVATVLETSPRTVAREWSFARAWLHDRLGSLYPQER